MGMVFVGHDWAEAHHDVFVMDEHGQRLAGGRFPEGVDGVAGFHANASSTSCARRCGSSIRRRWPPSTSWVRTTRWPYWPSLPPRCSVERCRWTKIASALRRGSRQRRVEQRAVEIQRALRTPQLEASAVLADAMGASATALVAVVVEVSVQIRRLWAFAALGASAGPRAFYDQRRAAGDTHHRALRALANRLVGLLHGCLRHGTPYDEHTAWSHRQQQAA